MLDLARIYLFVFGSLSIGGGVLGLIKAKSKASLLAGGLAGAMLLVAGYLLGTAARAGLILGLIVSIALAARFVPAFLKTKKAMPAGCMAALSVIGIVLTVIALM